MSIIQKNIIREISYRKSVASSVLSKITGFFLQILALPIAANSLGVYEFALFTGMLAVSGWISLANLGLGPELIARTAKYRRNNNLISELASTAIWLVFKISIIVTIVFLIFIYFGPVEMLFNSQYSSEIGKIKIGLTVLAILYLIQSMLSVVEYVQAGLQEQYKQSVWSAIANLLALIAIISASNNSITAVYMILFLNGTQVFFRIINSYFFNKKHKKIRISSDSCSSGLEVLLLKSGLWFSLASGVANFVFHVVPVIIAGKYFSPESAAEMSVVMNLVIIFSGVASIINMPLWAAVADGEIHNDWNWIRAAYKKAAIGVFGLSLGFILVFAIAGQDIFKEWYQGLLSPDYVLILTACIYGGFLIWDNLNIAFLVGLSEVKSISTLMMIKAVLATIGVFLSVILNSFELIFIMLIIASAISTAFFFPVKIYKIIRIRAG